MQDEPRTEKGIRELVETLMVEAGCDPADVQYIEPLDGGWSNACSYRVVGRVEVRLLGSTIDDGPRTPEARARLGEALKAAFPPKNG